MSEDIIVPRFAQSCRHQPMPDMSEDIEGLFWKSGYSVNVTRLSSKRYRVTFLNNPWKYTCDDDIMDDVGYEMDNNPSKWRYWELKDDMVVPDSWLLTAP